MKDEIASSQALPLWLIFALAAVIVAGVVMRFLWPGTTVFCNDQARACAMAEDIASGQWASAGLPNSGGFRNLPGFPLLLAAVWRVSPSPMALLYFTIAINIAAMVLSFRLIEQWMGTAAAWWSAALFASAPWAIQYCRWIWAQDLLFPIALGAYFFLWRWVSGGKWAILGLTISLALLVQVHLAGIAVVVAVAIYWLWARPRIAVWPLTIGILLAAASFMPYLFGGHVATPGGGRVGYEADYMWRVFAGAAMSVTGLGWNLEFGDGYAAFARSLHWRRLAYLPVLALPAILLAFGAWVSLARLWRSRREGLEARRRPLAMIAVVALLVLLSFDLLGIRTSPTYLPLWYPLPFALMGWAAARLASGPGGRRAWLSAVLLVTMAVQLAFFAEQLNYMRSSGGVPASRIERSYAGATADIEAAAQRIASSEVWLLYEGNTPIQDEAAAWLFRRARWGGQSPGRTLLRFAWGGDTSNPRVTATALPPDLPAPAGAFLVRPWRGRQQADGRIPHVGASEAGVAD